MKNYSIIKPGAEISAIHIAETKTTKLRIGYFADGLWGVNAFNLIKSNPELEVAFFCGRYNKSDTALKEVMTSKGVQDITHPDVNSESFINLVRSYNCDLFVSMSFNQIFRRELINLTPMKTINCHAGALPFYRGRNILNWALINDEESFGITVHYMDDGIDTGDIILQRGFKIDDSDDYGTLLDCAHIECAKILYDSIMILKTYEIEAISQTDIHPVGFYCSERKVGDEIISWNQKSRDIFNFIRAICKPGPIARSFIDGTEVKINKAYIIPNAPHYKGIPGSVIGRDKDGVFVKTADSFIKIIEYESPKRIPVGARFN